MYRTDSFVHVPHCLLRVEIEVYMWNKIQKRLSMQFVWKLGITFSHSTHCKQPSKYFSFPHQTKIHVDKTTKLLWGNLYPISNSHYRVPHCWESSNETHNNSRCNFKENVWHYLPRFTHSKQPSEYLSFPFLIKILPNNFPFSFIT